jgi:hypothetical protein
MTARLQALRAGHALLILVVISVRGLVNPRVQCGRKENAMASLGIDLGTFRLAAAVPRAPDRYCEHFKPR